MISIFTKKQILLKKTLPFFSYLFHPIFISVFASMFYFLTTTIYFIYETVYLYLIQVLLITIFIPLACFYLLTTLGKIDSIMIENVSQRKIPLFLQVILTLFLILKTFTATEIPELFYFFLGSIISSLLALILVFLKQKPSLHMIGISSLTVFCMGCCFHFHIYALSGLAGLILINGIVASSRLIMKAHTNQELLLGLIIGVVPQTFLMLFWL